MSHWFITEESLKSFKILIPVVVFYINDREFGYSTPVRQCSIGFQNRRQTIPIESNPFLIESAIIPFSMGICSSGNNLLFDY
jgi:hypothetical protein